ncbi:MAG: ATP synthase F1 subunit epsilon [Verrucomicrobiales bacterium]|nr:ATP synthase F1 subunit epsilon [Verrucomicrobiales bacterium]
MALKLEIVTPEALVFSDVVSTVVLPGSLGEMGVLPKHAPLVTSITPGELRYTKDSHTTEMAVGEGFVEVTGDSVKVLTDLAIAESAIDEAAVQAALERAQDRLKQSDKLAAEEVAAVEASIAKSLAQLRVKRKRHQI